MILPVRLLHLMSDVPMPDTSIRVLIVDDEPLARERLRDLLADTDAAVVGEARDGTEALSKIEEQDPDLVFLDVQMPEVTGLDVVEQVGAAQMPLTVFVTAYDQYALEAFDASAVDYLLKPFDDERFASAFERARQRLNEKKSHEAEHLLQRLLEAHPDAHPDTEPPDAHPDTASDPSDAASEAPLERIAVQKRGQTRIVPVDTITHITADGSYATLHTPDDTHLIRERMKTLAERLPSATFMRIHRSAIVRLDMIDSILRKGGGNYAVHLHNGTRLSLSRNRLDALHERLGLLNASE